MYKRLSECEHEHDRKQLQKAVWEARHQWWLGISNAITASKVARGGVICSSKKLHVIKSVSTGAADFAGEAGARLVVDDFETKWAVDGTY